MIKENEALNKSIEWIRNNPYTEEIINVSEVELLDSIERIDVSEIQGSYPVNVRFTAMQKIEVTYRNKYNGLQKDIIVAGFDAIRYQECRNNMYDGDYLNENIISIEFIGEYSKTIETIYNIL